MLGSGPIKEKLAAGDLVVGTMVFEFGTTGVARLAAAAGAEFVIFDMEHTGWTSETTRNLFASSRAADLVPIVRVPANQYHLISTQLDLGARGVMVPMIETVDGAREVARSMRYPPDGGRGAAFGIAHDDYLGGDITTKMSAANAQLLSIVQVETARGLDRVEDIAAVDGIDMLWMGQFDLTNSLGVPGRFDDPAYVRAVDRFVGAARSAGKHLGALALSVDEAKRWIDLGFNCIAYAGDLWLYRQALAEGLSAIRAR